MNWMHYLVEANLYMAAFYALYLLFLRSETHYQLNRAYLLGTSLLAFIIPFVQLGVLKPAAQTSAQISVGNLSGYAVALDPGTVAVAAKWTMEDYILLAYCLVAIVLLISLCIRVYLLMALLKKGSVTKKPDFNIIELHQGSVAFSFFNNLFIDDRLASSQTILHHEQVHIRQKHSWDIIYLEFLKIINWFNPIVYLIIASIKEVHEFIADEETAGLENSNDNYTDFLISNAYGITQNSLTNSFFNKNLLKRRITMLYQKKSGKAARLKYLLALPLICGLLCLSTLAFTTKTYGFVDLAPRRMLAPNVMNATLPAPVMVKHHKTAIASYGKNPILIIDYKTYTGVIPAGFDFNKAEQADYGKLLKIDPLSITTISMMDPKAAMTLYGKKAVNGIIIITTKKPEQPNLTPAPSVVLPQNQNTDVIDTNNKVFTAVQIQPEFPGGVPALSKFVQTNVRYPSEDHNNKVQGKAYIQFIVEQDGSVDNLKVLRAPSEAMGKEAMRVMASSPKWKPGTQNGKPVRVEFTMPINFALNNDGPNAPFNINIQPPPPPAPPVKLDGNNFHVLPPPPVKEVEASPNAVYTAVEIQPEFPGGESGLTTFLQKNIRYPLLAKQNKIQGKVYIQFVVEKDGSITDIKVIREPGSGTGDEAVRVMKLSPKWSPGTQNGKPVRVQFTLPVNFALGA